MAAMVAILRCFITLNEPPPRHRSEPRRLPLPSPAGESALPEDIEEAAVVVVPPGGRSIAPR
jgi:hypothetical protein